MTKRYIVSIVIITEPRYSVDGKKHRTTNYYSSESSLFGHNMSNWVREKKKAKIFDSKREANRIAKRFDGKVCECK